MVNISHDPRWGRVAEGFGEDPYLDSRLTAAAVEGLQGSGLVDRNHVIACLKHYVGYGSVEGGRDYNQAEMTPFTLWNYHLPAFLAGIHAGAMTVMSAFNSIGGIPASADRYTLHHVLRGQLGFKGLVVSDWGAVGQLVDWGYARSAADAARRALYAGVDMEMFSDTYKTLVKQVRDGKVSIAEINQAVRRILSVKFASGIFEHPYASLTRWQHAFYKPTSLRLAFQAAERSCVLLKNANDTLPLSNPPRHIALIGPLVNSREQFLGCWHDLGGTRHMTPLSVCLEKSFGPDIKWSVVKTNMTGKGFHRAVVAAKAANLVIMAVGESWSMTGENTSRKRIGLPGKQQLLFNKIAATGKPIVTLLFNGRPLALPTLIKNSAAVLECWQLGTQTAPAVAAILKGKYDPSGRLTMDFPRSVGQIPVFYDHLNTGRPNLGKYIDGTRKPEFCFGYGLSYTRFHIGPVQINTTRSEAATPVIARAQVTNIGKVPGTSIVELYIRCLYFKAGCRPVRELKGFSRVHLAPGQTKTASFSLGDQDWGYYASDGKWLVEPSHFDIWISSDSSNGRPAHFELRSRGSPGRAQGQSVIIAGKPPADHRAE
jgi:beta-glucosidase